MSTWHCNGATANDVVWLRHLLVEMGYSGMVSDPTVVRGDNTAAHQMCYEDIVTSDNRIIIMPYHYNKEVVTLRLVAVKYVKSEDNLADLTTETVGRIASARLTDKLAGCEAHEEAQGWIVVYICRIVLFCLL